MLTSQEIPHVGRLQLRSRHQTALMPQCPPRGPTCKSNSHTNLEKVFHTCEQSPLCSISTWQEAHSGGRQQKPGKANFSMWQLQACLPRPENRIAFPRLSRGGRTKQTNTPLLPTTKALILGCAQTDTEHHSGGFQEINPCVLLVQCCLSDHF